MPLLDAIAGPDDLKRLPLPELPRLADEVRGELLRIVSDLGGHLASSLGAVELCIALHYVFTAPHDQMVWDMGYQAYTHKLLTGRREQFKTLKQLGGMSGFCNKDESPFDLFSTGHGGTCLSTAMGLAIANDAAHADRHIVAIIGDASLGEGMALEALNHIGHVKPNMLVILNDNKMSIAKPVGALSRYLNRIITNPLYNRIRRDMLKVVAKLPKGERLVELGHKMEETLKGLIVPGLLFEELGFRYVGPIDGHNLPEMITTLRNVNATMRGPILLHISTIKGKGYRFAEADPERFHKIEAFDLKTGVQKSDRPAAASDRRPKSAPVTASFTEAFSRTLIELGDTDPRIMAITAAMPEGTGVSAFAKRFPDRYIDVGMAEQHAVGLAAGLARAGLRPVVAIYATFLQRAYDQVMHELSLQDLPVVLTLDRASLVGEDGPTHHGVFDLAALRPLPNVAVLSPKDPDELAAMLRWAATSAHPVVLRYARGGILCGEPIAKSDPIVAGKAELLKSGDDLAIIAIGSMVYPALQAATALQQRGIDAAVVNARFAKPIDRAMLRELATRTGAIVTVEESQIAGGFGSAVSEALDDMGLSMIPLGRIGLPDQFVEHGKRGELLSRCQLDPASLERRIAMWHATIKTAGHEARFTAEPAP